MYFSGLITPGVHIGNSEGWEVFLTMQIEIPLRLRPTLPRRLFGFNEGSQWRLCWPVLVLTTNDLYLAVWLMGAYRRIWIGWRPNRLPYWVQMALAQPDPVFPCSFEVHVEDKTE